MPFVQGAGGQIVNVPSQSGGLLGALFDPSVQGQRLENQQAQLRLNQETAYQNGVPTDANGNPDLNAIARTQIQNGDINGGVGLLSTAMKMRLLNDPSNINNPTGQAGGGVSGGVPSGGAAPSGGAGGAAPAGGSGSDVDPMDVYAHSIGNIESSNNYSALGPKTQGGDQAYGRYQVMGSNVGPWTKEVLGQAMSPTDFLNNPQAQDAVFKAKFGQAVQQYGNPADAASVWFSGRPMARAGNASDSLGTTVPSYVSKFLSNLGPSSQALQGAQGGQGSPFLAPAATAGSPAPQPPLISFGGSSAQQPAATSSGSSDSGQISDSQVMAARNRLAAAQDADPSSMTVAQQNQLTSDTALVDRYTQQQNAPAAPASSGPASSTMPPEVSAAVARLRTGQGTPADKGTYLAWGQGQSGASAGTVNGAPTSAPSSTVSATEAAPGGTHPFGPGSNANTETRSPLPGAAPAGGMAPGGAPALQGGFQLISFAGGAAAPQGGAPAVPPPVGAAMPPDVSAALSRLRNGQGNPTDSAAWGAYLKSQQGGGAASVPQMTPGGPPPAMGGQAVPPPSQAGSSPVVPPQGSPGAAAPVRPAAPPPLPQPSFNSPAQQSGPDIPGLPAGYQDPGGGQRYVSDVMNRAGRFIEGDPRIAIWENKAKQVMTQLEAAQTFRNNLVLAQARANDRYNSLNSQGAIDAAGAKAGAEATERNKLTLVPSVQSDGSTIMIPQSDAVTAANSGKPIVSQQPGYVTQGQGNLLTKLNDGSKAYQERQVASQRLDALSGLLENYQTGANSTAFNDAVADLRSLGVSVPNSATANPGAMQEFTKNAYANVLASMKEQGNKQYAAEVQSAVNSNPNPDLQPEANAAMIAQMQGTKRWYDQNYRDYSKWYHGNKGAADDADFQTGWADQHPLGAYVSAAEKDIAPVGLPTPSPDKLVDGQAYQSQGVKKRWSASTGQFVPFTGPTAPALGGGDGGRSTTAAPPAPGARQAPDGQWYVNDPSRPGKFLMVTR